MQTLLWLKKPVSACRGEAGAQGQEGGLQRGMKEIGEGSEWNLVMTSGAGTDGNTH